MRNHIKHIACLILLVSCSLHLAAQQLSSAYFMEGFSYGHELNPAKDFDRNGYFSIPFLPGNLEYSNRGNLGLNDLFRQSPDGSGVVSYLNPVFSSEDALKRFSENNRLISDIRYDLLSFGYHTKHAYQNFAMAIRTTFNMNIPFDFFQLTKDIEKRSYNVKDMDFNTKGWFEMAWGYSRQVAPFLRLGAKVKVLMGLGRAKIDMNELNLDIKNSKYWIAKADASAEISLREFEWGQTTKKAYSDAYMQQHPGSPQSYDAINLRNMDFAGPTLNNYGLGADLGAELDLGKIGVKGLKVSAAINDISYIHWRDITTAQNVGEEFVFTGFKKATINSDNSVDFDELDETISNLLSMQDGGKVTKNEKIGTTVNAAVEYALPFYDRFSLGFLYTARHNGDYSWNEEHIAANFHPTKWLEMSANIGFGSLNNSFGWMFNFHPNGLNIFVGGDHYRGHQNKQAIPLKNTTNISLGINFPISDVRRSRHKS